MQHQSRTLLIVVAVAVAGVWALGYGAQRYARILEGRQLVSTERTQSDVDLFIEVRRAMRREIESWQGGASRGESLRLARDRAMVMHRVARQDYQEIRRQYRRWREGTLQAGSPMASALERRRRELIRVDLGGYESLDS